MSQRIHVEKTLEHAAKYIRDNIKLMSLCMLANFLLLILGFKIIGGSENPLFLGWVSIYYVATVAFFRFYFNRQPCVDCPIVFDSLIPSTKILVIGILFVFAVFAVIPFLPFFFGLQLSYAEEYLDFLDLYMDQNKILNVVLNLLSAFAAPFVFVRPFMAWISSILGRSGALKTAFARTENNYWQFVLISFILILPIVLYQQIKVFINLNEYFVLALLSVLIIYYNLVFCKIYEFFNK